MPSFATRSCLIAIYCAVVVGLIVTPGGAAAVTHAEAENSSTTWSNYVSSRGFSLEFPSLPKVEAAHGSGWAGETASAQNGNQAYMTSWANYEEALEPQQRLQKFLDGAVKNQNGEIIKSSPVKVDGWQGMRHILKVTDKASGTVMAGELSIFASSRRLIAVLTLAPEPLDQATFRNFERFHRSLRITAVD